MAKQKHKLQPGVVINNVLHAPEDSHHHHPQLPHAPLPRVVQPLEQAVREPTVLRELGAGRGTRRTPSCEPLGALCNIPRERVGEDSACDGHEVLGAEAEVRGSGPKLEGGAAACALAAFQETLQWR